MSKINLIPEIRQEQKRIKKVNLIVTSTATIIAIVVGVTIFILVSFLLITKAQISATENETKKMDEQLKAYAGLEATVTSLETGLNEIKSVLNGGPEWSKFFTELEKVTPADVQITAFRVEGSAITMSLTGNNVSSVDRFMKSFADYKVNDQNLFSGLSVTGFTRKENKVNFEAQMELVKGVLWK